MEELLKLLPAFGEAMLVTLGVTVTLEVTPNGEMGFAASAKVTAKAPQVQFGQSFFFQDRNGNLARNAPDLMAQGHFKMEKNGG